MFDSSWRARLKPRQVQLAALRLPRRQRDKVLRGPRGGPAGGQRLRLDPPAIPRDVPGLSVDPPVAAGDGDFYAKVDRADEDLRIILEADSFEFHATRGAFDRAAAGTTVCRPRMAGTPFS